MWQKYTEGNPPRLASLVDYLWYTGEKPAFDSVGGGLPPALRVHQGQLYYIPNKEFDAAFNNENIIASISLFALTSEKGTVLHLKPAEYKESLRMRYNVDTAGPGNTPVSETHNVYRLEPTRIDDFESFLARTKELLADDVQDHIDDQKIQPTETNFFLSIKFRSEDKLIKELYDLESPWCFPVQYDAHQGRFARVGVVGGEVPKLSLYATMWKDEYSLKRDG